MAYGTQAIAATDTPVLDENSLRRKVIFTNRSVNIIYVTPGQAIAGEGIPLYAYGSYVDEPDNLGYIYKGAWNAIASVGASDLSWVEL